MRLRVQCRAAVRAQSLAETLRPQKAHAKPEDKYDELEEDEHLKDAAQRLKCDGAVAAAHGRRGVEWGAC